MKIVINAAYGGFMVTDAMLDAVGAKGRFEIVDERKYRNDPRLIAIAEQMIAENPKCKLCIMEIPDETTDWRIEECDGMEWIYYVLEGKIHSAFKDRNG